jgi:O-antigen/teichoic acid export membrane protein
VGVLPIHTGVAVISAAAIPLTYGPAYASAIPVLSIAAMLAIPKGFYWLPLTLFQAADRQATTLRWLLATAVVNIGADFLLIPRYGAIGAAIANGVSQSFAIIGMWFSASRDFDLRLPWNSLLRTAAASAAMGCSAFVVVHMMTPLPGLLCAIPAGVLIYVALLRQFRVLHAEDTEVIAGLASRLPKFIRPAILHLARFIAAPETTPAARTCHARAGEA